MQLKKILITLHTMICEMCHKMMKTPVHQQMERILVSYIPRGVTLWHLRWISETSCELSFEIKQYLHEMSDVSEFIPLQTKWRVVFDERMPGPTVHVTTPIRRPWLRKCPISLERAHLTISNEISPENQVAHVKFESCSWFIWKKL